MVEAVEEEVQLAPGCKPGRLGDELVVGGVELSREASKHGGDGQVKFMVAIERCRVVCHCGDKHTSTVFEAMPSLSSDLGPGCSLPHCQTRGLRVAVTAPPPHP